MAEESGAQVGFHGLSPVTAELVGEISRLTVALVSARQQLKAAQDEVEALRQRLAAAG